MSEKTRIIITLEDTEVAEILEDRRRELARKAYEEHEETRRRALAAQAKSLVTGLVDANVRQWADRRSLPDETETLGLIANTLINFALVNPGSHLELPRDVELVKEVIREKTLAVGQNFSTNSPSLRIQIYVLQGLEALSANVDTTFITNGTRALRMGLGSLPVRRGGSGYIQ
jgi:hypothetical protein